MCCICTFHIWRLLPRMGVLEGRGRFLRFHLFFIVFCSFHNLIYPQSLAAFGQKKSGNDKNTAQSRISAPTLESFRHSRYQRWGRLPPIKSYQQPPAYPRNSPAGITYNLNNVCNAGVPPVPGQQPASAFQRRTHKQSITSLLYHNILWLSIEYSLYLVRRKIGGRFLIPINHFIISCFVV